MNVTSPSDDRSGFDAVVITHESRVEVLEGITKSYLVEISCALEQAKIDKIAGKLQPSITGVMLEFRVRDLQARVDSWAYKLEGIDAL